MSTTSDTGHIAARIDVRSPDGTPIAVWVQGDGPAIVMVHGSPTDHTTFDALVAELRSDMTTCAMDRRGSGASGDTEPYSIERESEDVAAVIDAIAAEVTGPVAVWGHSYGCGPAMGAAARSDHVAHLVLYEPSLGLTYPDGAVEAIESAVADGDREAAVRAALVDTTVMTAAEFDAFKQTSRWPSTLAVAPTLGRECRVEHTWRYVPGQFDAITAATLLLTGSDSDATVGELTRRAAAAIPDAQIRVLDGHGHLAYATDPAIVAAIVRDWTSR